MPYSARCLGILFYEISTIGFLLHRPILMRYPRNERILYLRVLMSLLQCWMVWIRLLVEAGRIYLFSQTKAYRLYAYILQRRSLLLLATLGIL